MSDWHDAAIKDFETGDFTYGDLAVKYGRKPSTITKLIARKGSSRPEGKRRRGGRRPFSDQKSLSTTHFGVGVRLGMYRALEQANVSQIGERLNTSRLKVSSMEKGFHDFTLNELLEIASLVGTDLFGLLTPRHPRSCGDLPVPAGQSR